jgi:hypothetical protein
MLREPRYTALAESEELGEFFPDGGVKELYDHIISGGPPQFSAMPQDAGEVFAKLEFSGLKLSEQAFSDAAGKLRERAARVLSPADDRSLLTLRDSLAAKRGYGG